MSAIGSIGATVTQTVQQTQTQAPPPRKPDSGDDSVFSGPVGRVQISPSSQGSVNIIA